MGKTYTVSLEIVGSISRYSVVQLNSSLVLAYPLSQSFKVVCTAACVHVCGCVHVCVHVCVGVCMCVHVCVCMCVLHMYSVC